MNYVNDEKTLANFADNDKFYSDRMENRISPESSLWNPWHGCHKLGIVMYIAEIVNMGKTVP